MRKTLLVPAAGKAVRMGGLLKELLPLGIRWEADGDRELPAPVIVWTFRTAIEADIDSALVVTSSSKAAPLMDLLSFLDLPFPVTYLHQPHPRGLAHAILEAAPCIRGDEVVVLLMPDTVVAPASIVAEAVRDVEAGAPICATLHQVERPEHFGVAVFGPNGRLTGFCEKPASPPSRWVWTSVSFRRDFFDLVAAVLAEMPRAGLTEVLDRAAKRGDVEIRKAEEGGYWDVGTYDGYLSALTAFTVASPPSRRRASPAASRACGPRAKTTPGRIR